MRAEVGSAQKRRGHEATSSLASTCFAEQASTSLEECSDAFGLLIAPGQVRSSRRFCALQMHRFGALSKNPHLRHRFGYRMAALVPLHRLAQIMGHDSLDTTMLYVQGTKQDVQQEVEKIAWA